MSTYAQIETQNEKYPKNLVSFSPKKIYKTGIGIYETSITGENKNVKALFIITLVGNKFVTILAPMSFLEEHKNDDIITFKGVVEHIRSDVECKIIDKYSSTNNIDYEKAMSLFSPYIINCYYGDDKFGFSNYVSISYVIILATLIYFLWTVLRLFIPKLSSTNTILLKHIIVSLKNAKDSIDNEMSDEPIKFSKIVITKSWFIYESFFKTLILPLEKIIWIYKLTGPKDADNLPNKQTNLFIYTSEKQFYRLNIKNKEANKLLEYIQNIMPDIPCKYDIELKNLWKSDKDKFVQEIATRQNDTLID